MPATTPVPRSAFRRIANRITEIRPMFGVAVGSASTVPRCDLAVFCQRNPDFMGVAWRLEEETARVCEELQSVQLAPQDVSAFDIYLDVETCVLPDDDVDSTRPLDASQLWTFVSEQRDEAFEWEHYPEPLWDPVRSEVRLLIREYFAQADADSERTEP